MSLHTCRTCATHLAICKQRIIGFNSVKDCWNQQEHLKCRQQQWVLCSTVMTRLRNCVLLTLSVSKWLIYLPFKNPLVHPPHKPFFSFISKENNLTTSQHPSNQSASTHPAVKQSIFVWPAFCRTESGHNSGEIFAAVRQYLQEEWNANLKLPYSNNNTPDRLSEVPLPDKRWLRM